MNQKPTPESMSGKGRNLEAVLAGLGESGTLEAVSPFWQESMASMPETMPGFLTPSEYRESLEWCGFDKSVEPFLDAVSAGICANPDLTALAWHCCCTVFEYDNIKDFAAWPELAGALGKELSGGFQLIVALDLVRRLRRIHAGWGIPEQVTRETCAQVRCFCDNHIRGTGGRIGIYRQQARWLRMYIRNRYFRLGRFEFILKEYTRTTGAFKNTKTGAVLALSKGTQFEGNPVLPDGRVEDRSVTLSRDVWTPVLAQGHKVLEMHIPAGGGMSPEACRDSVTGAVEFFRKHFPAEPATAIVCNSWIFNPQLELILPPDANLVALQREVYLLPVPDTGDNGLWFIFLQDKFDPATAPRTTSLQRAILDFIGKGNTWHSGSMFFLIEDISRWGTSHYRTTWQPPTHLSEPLF